ncbi:inositol 1,4,5-trisphosphate receptor-interacting protein-like [Protopterus annectens]|uniref:inositol 1,4,5-trisphosphate receptor-interacting protein-like n=1 Tax=Protopterus annectens TaxID=7888 RepID=UPI001CF99E6B|nr:inositol 1,4,5-trisphosphate receptor-interacting protein-like [Protopterus annectens]
MPPLPPRPASGLFYFILLFCAFVLLLCIIFTYCCRKRSKPISIYQQVADKIAFPNSQLLEHKVFTENIVKKLLNKMQELSVVGDPDISSDIIQTGSAFEDLKVIPQIEFDFLIPISVPSPYLSTCEFDIDDIPNAFGKICISKDESGFSFEQTARYRKPGNFLEKMCNDHYLSSKAVREWFQSLADRAANVFKGDERLVFKQQGPARTLKIIRNGNPTISVDLVPAIKNDNVYLVAKIYGGQFEMDHCKDVLWRLSFSVQEKAFLEQKDLTLPKNACHKRALQILKYLKQEERNSETPPPHWCTSLSSYHLKTLWLHQLHKTPASQWVNILLRERVIELLNHLIHSLESKTLHHFFMGNAELIKEASSLHIPTRFLKDGLKYNLYDEIHYETMNQAVLQLKKLKKHIDLNMENILSKPSAKC